MLLALKCRLKLLQPRRDLTHLAKQVLLFRPLAPKVVLLYEANPVFASPPEWRVREAFEKVPFIASFDSFLNESSVMADLILPDHSPLESWLDQAPESGTTLSVASVAAPAVRPLYNTRSTPDVLIEVAGLRRLEVEVKVPENGIVWASAGLPSLVADVGGPAREGPRR